MTLIDKAEALAILAPAPNAKDGLWAKRKQALHDAIAALPARGVGVKPLDVLSGLSSYLGAGLGDDATTPEQYGERIRWGIDHQIAVTVQRCAEVIEELSKEAYSGKRVPWGQIKQAVLAVSPALAPTDAAQAREAAARLLLDMLHMRNGAHEGVTRDDAQAMWEAASTREGYAAVDAFLRSIIKEPRT